MITVKVGKFVRAAVMNPSPLEVLALALLLFFVALIYIYSH